MPNARDIYTRFVEFEEAAAEIYFRLASRFSPENQDLSSFWLDMGIQEKQHAGLLQFCLAEELFATDLPTETDMMNVRTLLSRLMRAASNPDITVEESFRIATQLECSEINTIYDRLTTPVHASMYLLQRKIATLQPDHLDYLLKEAKRFQVPDECVQELQQRAARERGI